MTMPFTELHIMDMQELEAMNMECRILVNNLHNWIF
jgi:hypothetical protein